MGCITNKDLLEKINGIEKNQNELHNAVINLEKNYNRAIECFNDIKAVNSELLAVIRISIESPRGLNKKDN